ncbi:MAG: hypothetical protein WC028_27715 [Candidatus Obscuribacterales bacterium]
MSKIQLVLLLSLTASLSWPPSLAVPSLLCIPKTTADQAQVADNGRRELATSRRIRVYYVNGQREWEAKALIINGQVKTIITRGSLGRPFASSQIDTNGFGSGIDFRGMPWEFHGFLDP